jgi:hypothetical protein
VFHGLTSRISGPVELASKCEANRDRTDDVLDVIGSDDGPELG